MNQVFKYMLFLLWLTPVMVHADTISLRADSWYPINGTPSDDLPGYTIEIAKKIWEASGHSLDYRLMPWTRAITEVQRGNIDCIVGGYKEDTPDFIFPEEEIGKIGQTFYVKKGESWKYTGDIASLKGVKLGTIDSYVYSDELTQYIAGITEKSAVQVINGDNALEQNLKKILAGRITATIDADYVAEATIKKLGLENQIQSAGQLTTPKPIYVACSPAKPSSKQYTQLLSDGIKTLRSSGELNSILTKYGLRDWR